MAQKRTNFERLLNPRAKAQMRRHAASVWSLCDGDPARLAEWCLTRIERQLCTPEEHRYLLLVIAAAHMQMDQPVKRVERFLKANQRQFKAWSAEGEKQRLAEWEQRFKALIERDNARRYAPQRTNCRRPLAGAKP